MSSSPVLEDLQQAIKVKDVKKVHDLLTNNLDLLNQVDFTDANNTILTDVASCQNLEITELIIKVINIEQKENLQGHLETAIQKGNWKFAEFLLENGVTLDPSKYKDNLLAPQIFKRDNIATRKNMLITLLRHRLLDPIFKNDRKETLLLQFIDRKNFVKKHDTDAARIAEILVDSGVELNKRDKEGRSALFRSISTRNVPLISNLINRGADVNRTDNLKRNPLMEAVLWDLDGSIIHLLLLKGADVNATCPKISNTPIHAACINNNEELIRLLIRGGANICKSNGNGDTPLKELINTKISNRNHSRSIVAFIKEFSKRKFVNSEYSPKDMKLILKTPKALKHFEKCTEELKLMSATELYAPHSFYSLLNNSIDRKKLAFFKKNEKLVLKFRGHLIKFIYYENDLRRIWDQAVQKKP